MLWKGRSESTNVDDRRGLSGGGKLVAGGGIIGVIILVANLLLGNGDVNDLQQIQQGNPQEMTAEQKAVEDERASFVKVVFKDTEDVWDEIFGKQNICRIKNGCHHKIVLTTLYLLKHLNFQMQVVLLKSYRKPIHIHFHQ